MLKNISTKKLFIFDLDGTVTESKSKISLEMGALLSELLKTKKVAIISGGKFDQFKKQFLAGLKANTNFANLSLFPTNSTTLYSRRKSGWQKKYEERLDLKEKKEIIGGVAANFTDVKISRQGEAGQELDTAKIIKRRLGMGAVNETIGGRGAKRRSRARRRSRAGACVGGKCAIDAAADPTALIHGCRGRYTVDRQRRPASGWSKAALACDRRTC